jgi:two component regulator propeller domain protein
VPAPSVIGFRNIYVSPDGSKLFILWEDTSHNSSLWMSADDGATWKTIFSKQAIIENVLLSADGSKIAVELFGGGSIYVSVDGGQSWTENNSMSITTISPDGSLFVGCSGSGASGYTTHISTDNGQSWTQKGTVTTVLSCPRYVSNNGTIIITNYDGIARSTDYGQTWTETSNVLNYNRSPSFSNNGNNIFDGNRISLDGGNHWAPSNAPIPAGKEVTQSGISDDGKKLFIMAELLTGGNSEIITILTSVDGGRTWHSEDHRYNNIAMSSDGSKLFNVYNENGNLVLRMGTLPASQPVTPGSGAGGAATPSASTSATPGQKPGKASGRLAETGTSTWTVGGLAVVAVAAGALVLRKRL